jgi:hypothetical protein
MIGVFFFIFFYLKIIKQYSKEQIQEYHYSYNYKGYEVKYGCVSEILCKLKHCAIPVFFCQNWKYN